LILEIAGYGEVVDACDRCHVRRGVTTVTVAGRRVWRVCKRCAMEIQTVVETEIREHDHAAH
jgi:hypothetical protein